MKFHQLVFDGIGTAGTTSNVLNYAASAATTSLQKAGAEVVTEWAVWPASMFGAIGGRESWQASSIIAKAWLDDKLKAIQPQDKIILLAYSGGNKPVHEWLNENPDKLHRISAVGFASDPFRPEGKQQHGMEELPGLYGLCGEDPSPIPDRAFWVAVRGDDITASPRDAILRTAADFSKGFPAEILEQAIPKLTSGNFQLAWQLKVIQHDLIGYLRGLGHRIPYARDAIIRYGSGYHTTHYRDPYAGGDSPMVRLGNTIAYKVKKDHGLLDSERDV